MTFCSGNTSSFLSNAFGKFKTDRAYRQIFCWWEICIICASETLQIVDCRLFQRPCLWKKSELMTSIPLSSCQFEKICIRFSLRFLKKSESTLVGSCLLKGDTWPAETRVLSRGRKREDPGYEVGISRHLSSAEDELRKKKRLNGKVIFDRFVPTGQRRVPQKLLKFDKWPYNLLSDRNFQKF